MPTLYDNPNASNFINGNRTGSVACLISGVVPAPRGKGKYIELTIPVPENSTIKFIKELLLVPPSTLQVDVRPISFLKIKRSILDLCAQDIDLGMDLLLDQLDAFMRESDFSSVDALMDLLSHGDVSEDILIGTLAFTLCAKDQLPNRLKYFGIAMARISESRGGVIAARLLDGLS